MTVKAASFFIVFMLLSGCNSTAKLGQPLKNTGPATAPSPANLKTSTQWHTKTLFQQAQLNAVTIEGAPTIKGSALGDSVEFNGDGDRLLVQKNPLLGAKEFTIETIIYPYDVYPNNKEPRFLHIESPNTTDRRITMELRLNHQGQWYFDGYIKSENSSHTLIDKNLVHPTNQWAHTAITYKNKTFTSYVNGKKELSAQVEYLPIADNAATSIGARINRVHWFNGQIHSVTVTPTALQPEQFKSLQQLPQQAP